MELSELKAEIIKAFKGSENDLVEVLRLVEEDKSIFPFNEYEHLICNLMDRGGLSYASYIDIRRDYISKILICGFMKFLHPEVLAKALLKRTSKA